MLKLQNNAKSKEYTLDIAVYMNALVYQKILLIFQYFVLLEIFLIN